jgi:hypothetical protein
MFYHPDQTVRTTAGQGARRAASGVDLMSMSMASTAQHRPAIVQPVAVNTETDTLGL